MRHSLVFRPAFYVFLVLTILALALAMVPRPAHGRPAIQVLRVE